MSYRKQYLTVRFFRYTRAYVQKTCNPSLHSLSTFMVTATSKDYIWKGVVPKELEQKKI